MLHKINVGLIFVRNKNMENLKKSINLFVVYAPEDELLKEKLVEHLSILRHQGLISVFDEGNINAGEDWQKRKSELLNNAQVILLLISSDLLASDNLYNEEVVKSLQRHNKGEACVVPVLLRDCVWKTSIFANLKSLPKNGYAVTDTQNWINVDAAMKDIALGIGKIVNNFRQNPNGTYYFTDQTNVLLPQNLLDIGNKNPEKLDDNNEHQKNKKVFYWIAGLTGLIIFMVAILLFSNLNKQIISNPPINTDTIPKQPITLQVVQGLWLSTNRQETFIAKMLFKDDFVEVFSRSDNKNLSWGIEKVTVENDRKLLVDYKDWGIRFSINVEDPSVPAQVDSIIFTYRSDTIKSVPIPLLNIILVRPLLAQQQDNKTTPNNPVGDNQGDTPTDSLVQALPMRTMPVDTNTVSLRQLKISPIDLIKQTPQSSTPAKANGLRKVRSDLKANRPSQVPQPEEVKDAAQNAPSVKISEQAVKEYVRPRLMSSEYVKPDTSMTLINRAAVVAPR